MRLLVFAVAAIAALATPAMAPSAPAIPPDEPGSTPAARAGSPAAATSGVSSSELRDEIAAAMRNAGGASGAWVADLDAGDGEPLFTEDAARRRIPASNQKLFTTAAFLDRLGPEGRLETRVYLRGERRGARRGTVAGDLVVVGDGDPAFGTAGFARRNDQPVTKVGALARSVAGAGIRRITGRILADDTIFDRKRRAGPYLPPLSGLSFNNGFAGDDYARAPELVAAKALKRELRRRGVRVAGKVGHANLAPAALERKPLAAVASPPASALIEETNVPSNNFFAEMLLKRLAAAGGQRGTRKRGAARVEAFARGLASDVQAVDGSGLSRRNRVAPAEIGDLLAGLDADKENGRAFRASLAVAGRSGTLAERMRGTAAEGVCEGKTGTLSDVSALSGYCEAGSHTIAFSILMNDVDVSAAQAAQDRIAAVIARYRP